jgi:hypothetical protein
MKGKELTALLILAVLMGLSLLHARYIEDKTVEISETLTRAEALTAEGRDGEALALAHEALESWLEAENHTHITLRHTEIELVIHGFYELFARLEDGGGTKLDYERMHTILRGIYRAEQIRWGSIF